MDNRAFELLIGKINDQKADHARRMDELTEEIREIKTLVQENRDFRMKLIGGSLMLQFFIAMVWHWIEAMQRPGH